MKRHAFVALAAAVSASACGGTLRSHEDAADTSVDVTDTTESPADVPADVADPCSAFPDDPCVVLEYEGGSEEVAVEFHVDVDAADFYLLVDTTGSMDESIADVAAAFTTDILPAAEAAFGDVQFGLGHFNDFPSGSYGQWNDMPFWHMLDVSTDFAAVQTELDTLPGNDSWGNGADLPESNVVALAITALGLGLDVGGATVADRTCTDPASSGYPCFRVDALPVIMMISDAPWHNGEGGSDPYESFTTHGWDDAVAAFDAAGIKFLGVHIPYADPGVDGLTPHQHFATATGSIDADGNPLVSTGDAASAGERAALLIDTLRQEARFDVACTAEDDPGDDRDATVFVESIVPESALPPAGFPDPTMDGTTFHDATQGTLLTFLVTLRNADHPSETAPVASAVWIVAVGDGITEIGRERIVAVVP